MKVTKKVKYNYKLTEETLEKDIDSFIEEARKGEYGWDYKFGMLGLRIIKQYFRWLQEKFENSEFEECKDCYHKLILFVFHSSKGEDRASFGYEDLLDRTKLDWEKILENYFLSMIKTCDLKRLSNMVSEYISARSQYEFDSDVGTLIKELDDKKMKEFEKLLLSKTEGMTNNDRNQQEIIYFLMDLAEVQKDKNKYLEMCSKLKGVLSDEEVEYLLKEFEESGLYEVK